MFEYKCLCVQLNSIVGQRSFNVLTSLFQLNNKKFICPTIGFTCKVRQLHSNDGPVCQTDFSVSLETWATYLQLILERLVSPCLTSIESFNTTFNNISVTISLVEKTRPAASH